MKIVYLAWGSLLWDPADLPITTWKLSTLQLPLEFSRISDKAKGRLTLVIDSKHGTNNYVWCSISHKRNINNAIMKLREREKTVIKNIAYINLKNGKERTFNTASGVTKRMI